MRHARLKNSRVENASFDNQLKNAKKKSIVMLTANKFYSLLLENEMLQDLGFGLQAPHSAPNTRL